jgi:flavonoid 3'-monooxygenase
MAELLRHPSIMKRAQEELDSVVGTNRLVSESDLQHLPYLQVILKNNASIK